MHLQSLRSSWRDKPRSWYRAACFASECLGATLPFSSACLSYRHCYHHWASFDDWFDCRHSSADGRDFRGRSAAAGSRPRRNLSRQVWPSRPRYACCRRLGDRRSPTGRAGPHSVRRYEFLSPSHQISNERKEKANIEWVVSRASKAKLANSVHQVFVFVFAGGYLANFLNGIDINNWCIGIVGRGEEVSWKIFFEPIVVSMWKKMRSERAVTSKLTPTNLVGSKTNILNFVYCCTFHWIHLQAVHQQTDNTFV